MSLDDIDYVGFTPKMKSDGEIPTTKLRDETFKKTNQTWKTNLLKDNYKKIENIEKELNDLRINEDNVKEVENTVATKTTSIARLEASIKFINVEEVPNNFVANRAIKLKSDWLENVKANSLLAYKEPEITPFVQPQENVISNDNVINKDDITNFVDKAMEEKLGQVNLVEDNKNMNLSETKEEIINEANKIDADQINAMINELYPVNEINKESTVEEPVQEVEPKEYRILDIIGKKESEPEKVEESEFKTEINVEEPVREEIITIPERVDEPVVNETQYFTFEEEEDNIKDKISNIEPVAEPINIGVAAINEEAKENLKENLKTLSLEDLLKKRNDTQREKAEREEALRKAEQEKEEAVRIRAEKEKEKLAKEEAIKKALLEEINIIESDTNALNNNIEGLKNETATINKDTESIDEGIARLNEIDIMVNENKLVEGESNQKTM